jgi:hypothetical protein
MALAIAAPVVALAQASGGDFVMRRDVVAGGSVASGGAFRMKQAIAQPVTDVTASGRYVLSQGFHPLPRRLEPLFCDSFEDAPCPSP